MTPDHQLIARTSARFGRGPQALRRRSSHKGPEADPAYLAWIRRKPCLVCARRQRTRTEAHHFGPRAFGRKAPDRHALPLCREHHRLGADSAHALGRKFAAHHGLDALREIRRLNGEYEAGVA